MINTYAIIHDLYTKQFIYNITYTQTVDYSIDNESICDNSRFIYETIHVRYNLYTNNRLWYS